MDRNIAIKMFKKNVFIVDHERPNIIEGKAKFLNFIKDLESYLINFEKNDIIKAKIYP